MLRTVATYVAAIGIGAGAVWAYHTREITKCETRVSDLEGSNATTSDAVRVIREAADVLKPVLESAKFDSACSREKEALLAENNELRLKVVELDPGYETLQLSEDQQLLFGKAQSALVLKLTDRIRGYALLSVNGENVRIERTAFKTVPLGFRTCKMVLTEITESGDAKFILSCQPPGASAQPPASP